MIMSGWFPDFFVFILGLIVGSFTNVLIYRLPKEESPVFPASHCPQCGHPIAFYDNVPVFSYLALKAHCRHCHGFISLRYPLIEIGLGILSVALWQRWKAAPLWFFSTLISSSALAAVSLIDFETFLIPDILSLGLIVLGFLSSPFNPLFGKAAWWMKLWISFRGALVGFLVCAAIAWIGEKIFKKEALGGGDIKLLAAVGSLSGSLGAFNCLMLGSLLGTFYGIALIIRGKVTRSDPVPFGPFLSAAAIFNLFYILPFGFPFRF